MNFQEYQSDPFLSTLSDEFYYFLPEVIYVNPEKNYTPIKIYLDDSEPDSDTDEEYEGRILLTGPYSCSSLKFVLDHIDKHGIQTSKSVFKQHIYPWVKKCPRYKNLYYKILKENWR